MRLLLNYLRSYRHKRLVRPWALSAPVLVLVIALPMLRPLRHPEPDRVSDDEQARLATVQAIVERGSLDIDGTDFTTHRKQVEYRNKTYSNQPPMMSALLSGAYWVMHRRGLTFERDPAAVAYLLTLLGVTIPAACAAGLVYRMGRLFELRRPWRAALAAASVLGTGLISYATVLNPHVPAAALVLASAACLIHITNVKRRVAAPVWLVVAGLCAALAGTIDPSALPFLPLIAAVVLVLRWAWWRKAGALMLYALGAAAPIAVHAMLTVPVTGDFWQGVGRRVAAAPPPSRLSPDPLVSEPPAWRAPGRPEALRDLEWDEETAQGLWQSLGAGIGRLVKSLLGGHGILSHFPVLLLGVLGVSVVMHRHWPGPAKVLAAATISGAIFLLVAYAVHRTDARDWRDAMFAARWFVVFSPILLFWSGAWLRRPHRRLSWAVAGVLLAFSVGVSIIGATGPMPHGGFVEGGRDRYTAAAALSRLLHPDAERDAAPQLIADREPWQD